MSLLRSLIDNNIERACLNDIHNSKVFFKPKEHLDKQVSLKQVDAFNKCFEYINKCTLEGKYVIEQDYIKNMKLTNYTFQDKGKYIWIVDKCIIDENTNEPYKYATISLGNDKLISDFHTQFIIWNVLQRVTCRNSTEFCRSFCYANRYRYEHDCSTRNVRLKNTIFSMLGNFSDIMIELIEFLNLKFGANIIFRFHESGDVYSQLYFSKIKYIMNECKDIKFMWYSKSLFVLDEINELNKIENVSIRYSLDFSTPDNIVKRVIDLDSLNTVVMPVDSLGSHLIDDKTAATYCNLQYNRGYREAISIEVEESEKNLQDELLRQKIAGKTIKKKINELSKIVKDNKKKFINGDVKCGSCLKCLNKNIKTISFCQHGR